MLRTLLVWPGSKEYTDMQESGARVTRELRHMVVERTCTQGMEIWSSLLIIQLYLLNVRMGEER